MQNAQPIQESKDRKVKLDNKEISVQEFNETLESLKPNQRVVETSQDSYHLIERMYS